MGLGQNADGFTSDVEAIDITNPNRSCSLPNYPYSVAGAFGIFGDLPLPIFCGSHNATDHTSECYSMDEKGLWTPFAEMPEKR